MKSLPNPEFAIKTIDVSASGFSHDGGPLELNRLNVFIGLNNAGKSRLLREVLRRTGSGWKVAEVTSWLPKTLRDWGAFLGRVNSLAETVGHLPMQNIETLEELEKLPRFFAKAEELISSHEDRKALENDLKEIKELRKNAIAFAKNTLHHRSERFSSVYIPILRGLRPLNRDGASSKQPQKPRLYTDRVIADHFPEKTERLTGITADAPHKFRELEIVTGLEYYDIMRLHLLGTREERDTIRRFENFLSQYFFQGEEVSFVPRYNKDVLYVRIGDEEERPIYELGDGIAQIVILTLPLFVHQDSDLLLFIEEPELNLHAGLQRKLIEAFLSPVKASVTRQVFVSTHSNQFLDITLDHENVSIFKVKRRSKGGTPFQITTLQSPDDFELLRELGVRNSSVFLANCTIWVEGITDRYYIRRFLEVILRRKRYMFDEDRHYSFVEYAGANITHWSFLDKEPEAINHMRIAPSVFLVVDGDGAEAESKKGVRHQQLREKFKSNCHVLKVIEVENLLTPKTIRYIVSKLEKTEVNDGQRISQSFKWEEYKRKRLGTFIDEKVLPLKSVRSDGDYSYAESSGTIKDKRKFCDLACEYIKKRTDEMIGMLGEEKEKEVDELIGEVLTDEAKILAEEIVEFIKEKNTSSS